MEAGTAKGLGSIPKERENGVSKKLPYTPASIIRNALRRYVWLRSRERLAALKRDKYTCQGCHRKQSKAKGKEFAVQVHHLDGIKMSELIKIVREVLLQHPDRLITYCKDCHEEVES